jgi:hypothetical protein
MKILEEYALTKAKIKDLQDQCKQIEPVIIEMIKKSGEAIKEDYGTFQTVIRKSFTYSEKLTEKIKKIEEDKKVEEIKGIAKSTDKEMFRFMPSKFAMPKGFYNFDKVKNLPIDKQ